MENTSYIAISRQAVLRRQMENVATNMANMNTTGFKAERMMFTDWMSRNRDAPFKGEKKLHFVQDLHQYRDTREGAITQTGGTFDVAINSRDGYFIIQTPQGERYTRNGSFTLDSGGQLVNSSGFPVLSDDGQPLFFTEADQNVTIKGDGTIETATGIIGRLAVVSFDNEQNVTRIGNSLYETDQQALQVDNPRLVQGALEESNVNAIQEMVTMIDLMRGHASIAKAVQKDDERIKKAIEQLSRER